MSPNHLVVFSCLLLSQLEAAPPANDHFAAAESLSGALPITRSVDLRDATEEPYEPRFSEKLSSRGSTPGSAWYRWSAAVEGSYFVRTNDFSGETIYQGGALESLYGVKGQCLRARQGEVFYFRVSGAATGHLSLEKIASENDAFSTALTANLPTGNNVLYLRGDVSHASRELGEPASEAGTLWWRLTVPSTTRYAYSGWDVRLYRGGAVDALEAIPSLEHPSARDEQLADLTAGEVVYAQVSLSGSLYPTSCLSNISFRVATVPLGSAAANDAFAAASVLPERLPFSFTAGATTATIEQDELGVPSYERINPSSGSWWWRWTSSTDRVVELSLPAGSGVREASILGSGSSLPDLRILTTLSPGDFERKAYFTALAGRTYYCRIIARSFERASRSVRFAASALAVPLNDAFASAAEITASPFRATLTGNLSTPEASDPPSLRNAGALPGTLWWHWTVPATGGYRLKNLRAFRGDGIAALTEVKPPSPYSNEIGIHVQAGEILRLVSSQFPSGADQTVEISMLPSVGNTSPETALGLGSARTFSLSVTQPQALLSPEPFPESRVYYWRWVAPADGMVYASNLQGGRRYRVTTEGTRRDSLAVGLPLVKDSYGASQSHAWEAKAGQVYLMSLEVPLLLELHFRHVFLPRPGNDDMASAIELPSWASLAGTAWTAGATREANEPSALPTGAEHTVWYRWKAPASGYATIEGFTHVWTKAASNTWKAERLIFPVVGPTVFATQAATEYWLCVENPAGLGAPVVWQIAFTGESRHDAFAAPKDLGNRESFRWVYSNIGQTMEAGERVPSMDWSKIEPEIYNEAEAIGTPSYASALVGSQWASWTAPRDGHVIIDNSFSNNGDETVLYEGGSLASLLKVEGSPMAVRAGVTYRVVIYSTWKASIYASFETIGNLSLKMVPTERLQNDHFANAVVLEPIIARSSAHAFIIPLTTEPGEPAVTGPSGGTAWWTYKAPVAGHWDFEVDLVGVAGSSVSLQAFRGDSLQNLTPLTPAPRPSVGSTSVALDFQTKAQDVVYFRLNLPANAPVTAVSTRLSAYSISFYTPAATTVQHDDFADAQVLPAALPLRLGSAWNVGAAYTVENGEAALPRRLLPYIPSSNNSRWYRWTPTVTQAVALHSWQSPLWEIYQGTELANLSLPTSLQPAARDAIAFTATAGVAYYIRFVGTGGSSEQGYLESLLPAPHSSPEGAHDLSGLPPFKLAGSLLNSSSQTLWWRWVAPQSVVLLIGEEDDNIALSVGKDQPAGVALLKELRVSVGETVWFRIGGQMIGSQGPQAVQRATVQLWTPPTNTTPAAAASMPQGLYSRVIPPDQAGTATESWWRWQALAGGRLAVGFPKLAKNLRIMINGQEVSLHAALTVRSGDVVMLGAFLPVDSSGEFTVETRPWELGMTDEIRYAGRLRTVSYSGQIIPIQANPLATAELAEPAHEGAPAAHSTWSLWRAPRDGFFIVSWHDSAARVQLYKTVDGIAIPRSISELVEVTAQANVRDKTTAPGSNRLRSLRVRTGEWLAIAVDGKESAVITPFSQVEFRFTGEMVAFRGDDFESANNYYMEVEDPVSDFSEGASLKLHGWSEVSSILGTTGLEAGEPLPAAVGGPWVRSRWYRLSADGANRASLTLAKTVSGAGALQLYEGEGLAGLRAVGEALRNEGDSRVVTFKPSTPVYLQVLGTSELASLEIATKILPYVSEEYSAWIGAPPAWFRGDSSAWESITEFGDTTIDGQAFGLRYLSGIPADRQVLTLADREALPHLVDSEERLELQFFEASRRDSMRYYGEWLEPSSSSFWQGPIEPEQVQDRPGFWSVSLPKTLGRTRLLRLRVFPP